MRFLKSSGAVGLELDTGIIRVVELSGDKHAPSLVAAGEIVIPEDAVSEGVVADVDAVARALEELWAKTGIGSREVVLGISNQGVLMRLAGFPKIPDNKLTQALRFQAGEYFPIPLAEMVFDHAVVGELDGDNGPQLQILLVAARRELLDKSLQAVQQASLMPRVVDAAPLALLRTLPAERLTDPVLLVDISNGLTTLLLVAGGVPRFARVIPQSLKSYARELNKPLDKLLGTVRQAAAALQEDLLSTGRAAERGRPGYCPEQTRAAGEERPIYKPGDNSMDSGPAFNLEKTVDKGQARQEGRPPVSGHGIGGWPSVGEYALGAGAMAVELTGDWELALANEIRSSIGYYIAQTGAAAVDAVIISGRGARVAGLPEFLQTEIDVPVEIINPLINIKAPGQVKGVDLQRKGPDFAVSIGLALRGLEE
ncbi:type IV pilus biogenesis protein PilM [Desulfoscipio sp. XC116]|uniref:type IV pilus biogenesis protein PilM n=1 Tax=Desulfoscipio sp. XC116 TaxID=3144975 RepID=UPI00325A8D53